MLSSQPQRKFENAGEEDSSPADFVLGSDEWPPSPPRRSISTTINKSSQSAIPPTRTAVSRPVGSGLGASDSFKASRTINQAHSLDIDNSTIRHGKVVPKIPQAGSTLPRISSAGQPARVSAGAAPPRMHPMFNRGSSSALGGAASSNSSSRNPSSSSSAYSSVRTTLPPSSYNQSSSSGASAAALNAVPKKRVNPWENLSPEQSRKRSTTPGSNFTTVGGPAMGRAGSGEGGSSRANLSSDALDIRQKMVLSPEQQQVLRMVVDKGESVFFTGSAGKPLDSFAS